MERLDALLGQPAFAAKDEPRAVYADWLLERGDPRGELIVLDARHMLAGRGDRAPATVQLPRGR